MEVGQMSNDALMEIRTALRTDTNTDGVVHSAAGGAEIQKLIDRAIVDSVNRMTDFRGVVRRRPHNQLAYIWNIRTGLGNKVAFYPEGDTGTPDPSPKLQLNAVAKSIRSDYEVTGLHASASASYYNAIADEAIDAASALVLAEEMCFISGADTNAYGMTGAYDGLLQLMGSFAAFGDTDVIYGLARAGARPALDVGVVLADPTSAVALELKHLDATITSSNKAGGKGRNRAFVVSEERHDEINQLLQSQQRFLGTLELEGGFSVSTYKRVPILASRFMDKNGITWDGVAKTKSYADNSLYLLVMDNIEFRVLNGVDMVNVAIMGSDASQRSDVFGGYLKTYGVFVMKEFTEQVLLANLAVPGTA
jgi:hypothetical protein